jgi:2-polyprenyl-3-methyl-5-hydroxy-6-metoxy-1,4-benzoquinol methylase
MSVQDPHLLEVIRRQFDNAPYPRVPLEASPKDDPVKLFVHTMLTPYYLRDQRVIDPRDRVILDAGCGSGVKSLALAIANPEAHIVSLDLSPASVEIAQQRLTYHGITNAEFHALSIYDLNQLGLQFDYINCDEVLYSLPDPVAALQVMQSTLKPDGIIRFNLHSQMQRQLYYRGQEIFKLMGLFDEGPTEFEAGIVREFMQALKPTVQMRRWGWTQQYENPESSDEVILMNYLLSGDKGFTIPQTFDMLRTAGLEFISMVHWPDWDIFSLLQDPTDLPAVWELCLAEATVEDQLRLFELLNPVNRLIDLWCGNPVNQQPTPLADWTDADWQTARVYLHPYVKTTRHRQILEESLDYARSAELVFQPVLKTKSLIDTAFSSCLLALWDVPLSFAQLVDHYLTIRPLDPATLEPRDRTQVAHAIQAFLTQQSEYAVVLVEQTA